MKNENFEEAMNELDAIVKRATALVRFCNEQLTSAEKKIEILTGKETV